MKPKVLFLIMPLAIAMVAIACSIVKREDPEKEVRLFIAAFEKSLSGSEEGIFQYINARQSKEAILAGIRVLQNKDMEFIRVTPGFANTPISFEREGVKVVIPIAYTSEGLDNAYRRDSELTLWLQHTEGRFVITRFEAERFYNDYLQFKNSLAWEVNGKIEAAKREVYFARAAELQQSYDSVIWYVNYQNKIYYYVVMGEWQNYFTVYNNTATPTDYKMGLVDETGKVIIPVEYDLIGTPGFLKEGLVEVKKDGQVGYYSLTGEMVVPADYTWVIPYSKGDVFALVKHDSIFGWIDHALEFKEGFPNESAAAYIKNFSYLPQEFRISEINQVLAEIPTTEFIGYGIVMPPTHWTNLGLFEPIEGGFVKNNIMNRAYVEYVSAGSSFLENVIEQVSVIMTTFTQRYLEGREEFYKYKQITFIDNNNKATATTKLPLGKTSFRKIDSTLLEVVTIPLVDTEWLDGEESELNIPIYHYYVTTNNGTLEQLKTRRRFAFTEFVKIDSSYITGDFQTYNFEIDEFENTTILSIPTLQEMRNEILAGYGFIFTDPHVTNQFKYRSDYVPRFKTYSDILGGFTETDQHNIAFLEKIVGTLDPDAQTL
jgi:hypothetical protein